MSVNILDNGELKSITNGAPLATSSTYGSVKPDNNTITINNGVISSVGGGSETPIATTEVAGKVKPDGTTITVTADGTISSSAEPVPIATTEVAGKVKPDGTTITVAADGSISSTENTPIATTSIAGKVKPDGSTITVAQDGAISVPTATSSNLGLVYPDNITTTLSSGKLSSHLYLENIQRINETKTTTISEDITSSPNGYCKIKHTKTGTTGGAYMFDMSNRSSTETLSFDPLTIKITTGKPSLLYLPPDWGSSTLEFVYSTTPSSTYFTNAQWTQYNHIYIYRDGRNEVPTVDSSTSLRAQLTSGRANVMEHPSLDTMTYLPSWDSNNHDSVCTDDYYKFITQDILNLGNNVYGPFIAFNNDITFLFNPDLTVHPSGVTSYTMTLDKITIGIKGMLYTFK